MRIDVSFPVDSNALPQAAALAKEAESLGFQGIWTPETGHNAFLPLVLAAEHTSTIEIGTAVAIAFPRSPMITAQIAWDLAAYSQGRFLLGLGTQVKAHIERRFATNWEAPVPRLREYIQALRAIWRCWQEGGKLSYQGEFYKFSLMTPFFNPGPISHPNIPIYIAGVNAGLAQLAGEQCDGFHAHPLNSAKYLREVLRPQIAEGASQANRDPQSIAVAASVFAITGPDERSTAKMRGFVRQQISFYASTPTYRTVLECHGWEQIGEQLSQLAAAQRWAEMPALISDEMLAAFAVEAPPAELGAALKARYAGLLDRVSLYMPFVPGKDTEFWRMLVASVHAE